MQAEVTMRAASLRRLFSGRRAGLAAGAVLAMGPCAAAPAFAYTAYVSNERDNSVSVVDLDKMQTIKTVPVGQRPRGIVISPDGKFLYVCAGDDDTVQIIDTKTLEVVGDLPSGPD